MIRLCVLAALCCFIAGGLTADEAQVRTLSLADCLQLASENNAALLNAGRDREIAEAVIRQARSEALPGLSLNASYFRLDEVETIQFMDDAIEMGTLDNYETTVSVEQLLYSGGRVRAALKAARYTRDFADVAVLEIKGRVQRDVIRAFYGILLAAEARDVAASSLEQLENLAADFDKRYNSGLIAEYDLLTARVRVAEARPRLISAENDLRMAHEYLARLLALDDTAFTVEGELTPPAGDIDLADSLAAARRQRSALTMQNILADLLEQDINAARSGGLPDFRARFNYVGANSYRFVAFDDEWSWHWNAQLVFSWALFDGGRTSGRVLEKRLNHRKAVEEAEDTWRAVRLEVTRAYHDWRKAGELLVTADADMALARRASEIAHNRHASGLLTTLELTDAILAERAARLRNLQAVYDAISAWADMQYAVGGEY